MWFSVLKLRVYFASGEMDIILCMLKYLKLLLDFTLCSVYLVVVIVVLFFSKQVKCYFLSKIIKSYIFKNYYDLLVFQAKSATYSYPCICT